MSDPTRTKLIEMAKHQVILPHVQISAILALTVLAAFLTSVLLLKMGVTQMAVRYPLAVAAGYVGFLILLRIWLYLHGRQVHADVDIDGSDEIFVQSPGSHGHVNLVGGSDSTVARTGGEWTSAGFHSEAGTHATGGGGSILDDASVDLDLGDIGFLILALVAIAGSVLALFYVIYIAPFLLGEILLDGVLAAGLYRRVKGIERQHWLQTALRKTAIPAVLVAVLFGAAGYFVQKVVPDAVTIGQAVRALLHE